MKDLTTEEIRNTKIEELSPEEQEFLRKSQEIALKRLTPEQKMSFLEDYAVCGVETAPPQKRKQMRKEFEKEFNKPFPLER